MSDLLRSLWTEPRPSPVPFRVWRDWLLVGTFVPAAVLEGALRPDLPWRAATVLVAVALAPVLLWRRTRPLAATATAFGVSALFTLLTGGASELHASVYLLLLPYALVRWGSGREVLLGSAAVLAGAGLGMALGDSGRTDVIGGSAVLLSACALGAATRYRARARLRELDQVKLRERERLARDLHDTVAHHVSAIAIRAQAGLAVAAARPDAATDALRVIEAEAARALTEMRAMVRVLRHDEPAALAPSPRIADVAQLAGRSRTGPAVDVELLGDLDDVAPSVGTAVYRLVQESVTNARRHARHATRIAVRVTADGDAIRLRVSDDGDRGPTRPAPGYGITGMIERAGLLGGSCTAGPDPDRGWTVAAALPRTGVPA